MSFLAPAWLGTAFLGVALASIPVILHFLFRSRYRVVPWAAMKFLLKSLEQTSRRIRFQELLLLLLRILLILFLAFAVMRPTSSNSAGGAGEQVDAFLLVDSSLSMDLAEAENKTRFHEARAAAGRILESLPQGSTAQILRVTDHALNLGPRVPGHREQARLTLDALVQCHEAADWLPSLQLTENLLAQSQSGHREIYLIGDQQANSWIRQSAAIKELVKRLSRRATFHVVHTGSGRPPKRNATLLGMLPQTSLPRSGTRTGLAVLVRNTGQTPLQNLAVALRKENGTRDLDTQIIPLLAIGETQAVTLSTRLERNGLQCMTFSLPDDDLAADNQLSHVLAVRDEVRVLVVDGRPNTQEPDRAGSYYLAHALKPVESQEIDRFPLRLDVVPPSAADPGLLATARAVILLDVATPNNGLRPEFLNRLGGFVRGGGGLMLFCGSVTAPDVLKSWQENFGYPAIDILSVGRTEDPNRPERIDVNSIPQRSILSAFRIAPLDRLSQTELAAWLNIRPRESDAAAAVRVLLKTSSGHPLVFAQNLGQGRILGVTTSADLTGSDWPLRPAFVPFVQSGVNWLLERQDGQHNRSAGDALEWSPPLEEAKLRFQLNLPAGQVLSLGTPAVAKSSRPTLRFEPASVAGIYRFLSEQAKESTESAPGVPFAVAPRTEDTETWDCYTPAGLDEFLEVPLTHHNARELTGENLDLTRSNREWTSWLLLALLIFLVGEMLFAAWCDRPK